MTRESGDDGVEIAASLALVAMTGGQDEGNSNPAPEGTGLNDLETLRDIWN